MRFPSRLPSFDPRQPFAFITSAGVVGATLLSLPDEWWPPALSLILLLLTALFAARHVRSRRVCVQVSMSDFNLLDIAQSSGVLHAGVSAGSRHVSQLRPDMRLRRTIPMSSASGRVAVVLLRAGSLVRWQDGDVEVPLEEPAEILGAVAVVSRGESPTLEYVYSSDSRGMPQLMAVRLHSSAGAVQSWDPLLLEPLM
jgi:hypothetical protein